MTNTMWTHGRFWRAVLGVLAMVLLIPVVGSADLGAQADTASVQAAAIPDGVAISTPPGRHTAGLISIAGHAAEADGIDRLEVVVKDIAADTYWNGRDYQQAFTSVDATLSSPGAVSSRFEVKVAAPNGAIFIGARVVDPAGNRGPQATTESTTAQAAAAPAPVAPTVTTTVARPTTTLIPVGDGTGHDDAVQRTAEGTFIFGDRDRPQTTITAPSSADHGGGAMNIGGIASDPDGVTRVIVTVRDVVTKDYWNGTEWVADYAAVDAEVGTVRARETTWRLRIPSALANPHHIGARTVDYAGTYGDLVSLSASAGSGPAGQAPPATIPRVDEPAVPLRPGSSLQGPATLCQGPVKVGVAINLRSHDVASTEYSGGYDTAVDREFCHVVSENSLKRSFLQANNSDIDYAVADAFVTTAERHGSTIRGHSLVWNFRDPTYIRSLSRNEILTDLNAFISTMMTRYPTVDAWDVVNEPFDWGGRGFWRGAYDKLEVNGYPAVNQETLETEAPQFVITAFEIADRVRTENNIDTTLWLNETNALDPRSEKYKAKPEALYQMVKWMVENDVPIDGVGFQAHLRVAGPKPLAIWGSTYDVPVMDREAAALMCANLVRYRDLGLEVAITEADIVMPLDPSPAEIRSQIDGYKLLYQLAAELGAADLTIWGLDDGHSFYENPFLGGEVVPGYGSATLFARGPVAKPVYDELLSFIRTYRSNPPAPVCTPVDPALLLPS